MIVQKDQDALRYKGMLGHRFAIVVTLENGDRTTAVETNEIRPGVLAEYENPKVYERINWGIWRERGSKEKPTRIR